MLVALFAQWMNVKALKPSDLPLRILYIENHFIWSYLMIIESYLLYSIFLLYSPIIISRTIHKRVLIHKLTTFSLYSMDIPSMFSDLTVRLRIIPLRWDMFDTSSIQILFKVS